MRVPKPPPIARLDTISPTVYEAARHCLARASWLASGDRNAVPPNPTALLGIGVHGVLQFASRLASPGSTEGQRAEEEAKQFDEKMQELFQNSHTLIRAKFGTPERIPFYNLYRGRAGRIASQLSRRSSTRVGSSDAGGFGPRRLRELMLTSRDQVVRGRPDLIDVENATVLDYKMGSARGSQELTESEARQLKLYAYLARENGIPVRKGVVERGNRTRAETQISRTDAEDEGRRAHEALMELNRFSGRQFEEAASPSPRGYRYCPCIPFCPAFWAAAGPTWNAECGIHIEGAVKSIEGEAAMSLHLQVSRGTTGRVRAVVSQFSERWFGVEQGNYLQLGEPIRVTDARQANKTTIPTEFRADRATMAIWRV